MVDLDFDGYLDINLVNYGVPGVAGMNGDVHAQLSIDQEAAHRYICSGDQSVLACQLARIRRLRL